MNSEESRDFQARAEERRRRPGVRAHLVKLKEADRTFDQEFWQDLTGEERLGAMWQLVVDMRILRGEDEVEPRLRRHIQNIKYQKG